MALSTTITLKFAGAAVQRGLASIKKGFSNLNKEGGKMFSSLVGGAMKWASILGPLAAGAGFAKLAMSASDTASEFEQMRLKFTMFTGSMEGAVKLMNELRKVDIVSNLDLQTLGEGAAKLMAFGVKADDVADIIEKLSKVSGGSADAFSGLALAFGQTMSNMSLKGDDLRQYVERGWNPLEQITRRTGESMAAVRKRMEDHKVTMGEVKQALDDVTTGTGRFARAHELGSKTFLAATSRMQSQWALLKDAFGTPLNVKLGEIFDQITAKLPQMAEQAKVFGDQVGSFLKMVVNSYNNGEVGTAIQDSFMLAVRLAGAELMGLAATAGELFAQAAKGDLGKGIVKWLEDINPLRNKETWGPLIAGAAKGSESEIFKTKFNSGTYQENRDAGYAIAGVAEAQQRLKETMIRNQDPLQKITPISEPGQPGYMSLAESMKQMIAEQKITNQRLAPQP